MVFQSSRRRVKRCNAETASSSPARFDLSILSSSSQAVQLSSALTTKKSTCRFQSSRRRVKRCNSDLDKTGLPSVHLSILSSSSQAVQLRYGWRLPGRGRAFNPLVVESSGATVIDTALESVVFPSFNPLVVESSGATV